jgi:SAM-dependent methyltransferase
MRSLRELWETHAREWFAWARTPNHDSYENFHRDQFLSLLPAPGRLTLDIGCGEGRLARDLHALGHRVQAIDASATLVAQAHEADRHIPVCQADAAALPFPDGHADLAVMFMSPQDLDDLEGAIREAFRVTEPGGRLALATVHPINSAGKFSSEDADSPFVMRGSYLDTFRYMDRFEHDGLGMTFHSDHRPLEIYVSVLLDAGFVIEALREPAVPDAAVRRPASKRWQRIPLFLHIRARRP